MSFVNMGDGTLFHWEPVVALLMRVWENPGLWVNKTSLANAHTGLLRRKALQTTR